MLEGSQRPRDLAFLVVKLAEDGTTIVEHAEEGSIVTTMVAIIIQLGTGISLTANDAL